MVHAGCMAIKMQEWGMLAYPGRGVNIPVQGVAGMDEPAARMGRAVADMFRYGAALSEQRDQVTQTGELAAFAGRLREIEQETRATLAEQQQIGDWGYAWRWASEAQVNEAIEELPHGSRSAARDLAALYNLRASLRAQRDYELAHVGRARQQWADRVEQAVLAGDGESAAQWVQAGRRVFVPESEVEARVEEVRSRGRLRRWQQDVEQNAPDALRRMRQDDAELPTRQQERQQLEELRRSASRGLRTRYADEMCAALERGHAPTRGEWADAVECGILTPAQAEALEQEPREVTEQRRCEWNRRVDERGENADDEVALRLDIATAALPVREKQRLLQRIRTTAGILPSMRRRVSSCLQGMYGQGVFGCPGDREALQCWGRLQEQGLTMLQGERTDEQVEQWLVGLQPAPMNWICLS